MNKGYLLNGGPAIAKWIRLYCTRSSFAISGRKTLVEREADIRKQPRPTRRRRMTSLRRPAQPPPRRPEPVDTALPCSPAEQCHRPSRCSRPSCRFLRIRHIATAWRKARPGPDCPPPPPAGVTSPGPDLAPPGRAHAQRVDHSAPRPWARACAAGRSIGSVSSFRCPVRGRVA